MALEPLSDDELDRELRRLESTIPPVEMRPIPQVDQKQQREVKIGAAYAHRGVRHIGNSSTAKKPGDGDKRSDQGEYEASTSTRFHFLNLEIDNIDLERWLPHIDLDSWARRK
jgi:hypothetical protein